MIYFLQEAGGNLAVKIGYTSSDVPTGRQKGCQTGNSHEVFVLATMPGERGDEAALHQRFADARLVGEWFRPVPELLQFLLSLNRSKQLSQETFSVSSGSSFHAWLDPNPSQHPEVAYRRGFQQGIAAFGWFLQRIPFCDFNSLLEHLQSFQQLAGEMRRDPRPHPRFMHEIVSRLWKRLGVVDDIPL